MALERSLLSWATFRLPHAAGTPPPGLKVGNSIVDVKEAPVVEDCPRCGRPMSIQLEHIGKPISCGHCGCECSVQIDGSSVIAEIAVAQRYRTNLAR
jgi:hypothetical protein